MTVQKFVTYNLVSTNGQISNDQQKLELEVLETSGNTLSIKIYQDNKNNKNKEQFQQKLEVKLEEVAVNLGSKKGLEELVQVQIVHLYGKVGVSFLGQDQEEIL